MDLFSVFKKKKTEATRDKEEAVHKSEEISQLDHLIEDLFNLDEQRYAEEKKAV